MKIIETQPNKNYVDSLEDGVVFKCADKYYIKVKRNKTTTIFLAAYADGFIAAYSISDNTLEIFEPKILVEKVSLQVNF